MQERTNNQIIRSIQPVSFLKRVLESVIMVLVIFIIALPLVLFSTPVKGDLLIAFIVSLLGFSSLAFYKIVSNSATLIYQVYIENDIVCFKTLRFSKECVVEIPINQLTLEIMPHGTYDCKLVVFRQSKPLLKQVSNRYWKRSDFEEVAKLIGVRIL